MAVKSVSTISDFVPETDTKTRTKTDTGSYGQGKVGKKWQLKLTH
jgi:hypothetical protein